MIEVKRGENISLAKITPHLNEIIIAVKWFKKLNDETEFQIDSGAFLLTEKNKIRTDADFIFYNQPNSSDNAVILKDEMFKMTLNDIQPQINKISFVLTLHNAKQKQQNFGMLEKIMIELFDFATKQTLASYILEDTNVETAIILAQLYRYHAEWKFKAIGQGYSDGLDVLAKHYGVNVESDNCEPALPKQSELTLTEINMPDLKTDANSKSAPKKSPKHINSDVDIHNTDMMTKQEHYEPIVQWLKRKNFVAEVDETAMDTSGFFDEVAVELGDNYTLLKIVSHNIKRRQQNNKDRAYIDLSNYSADEIGKLKKFCKHLYDYSFVAKYFYNASEKKIILHLQSAVKIVNFFNGEWLEWYAFMKIATLCHQQQVKFSCTRNMIINLADENKYEIDVFFLINEMPLFIECKSGEYRAFVDKYSKLRKKLFIPKPYFLMFVLGLDDEHSKGLTAMFDITFVNEKNLLAYVDDNLLKKNS